MPLVLPRRDPVTPTIDRFQIRRQTQENQTAATFKLKSGKRLAEAVTRSPSQHVSSKILVTLHSTAGSGRSVGAGLFMRQNGAATICRLNPCGCMPLLAY